MPKKITIVSAAALVLLLITVFVMLKVTSMKKLPEEEPPQSVSVLFPEKNEILIVSYEEFLAGCVRGLLPSGAEPHPEALRAVAIAEHSRAMYSLKNKKSVENYGADFAAGEAFPYDPDKTVPKEITAAVKELPRLTYEGAPFNAQMCKISAGKTDAAPPVSESIALLNDMNAKGYESSSAYTPEEVRRAMGFSKVSGNFGEWFSDPVYADTGTLLFIDCCGIRLTGAELRRLLSLRSTAIYVEYREDKFYFTCRGWGENRGMSVNAAIFLANSGSTAEEILEVFYPNAELSS